MVSFPLPLVRLSTFDRTFVGESGRVDVVWGGDEGGYLSRTGAILI